MLKSVKNENKRLAPLRNFAQDGQYTTAYLSLLVQRKKLKAKKIGRNFFTSKEWFNEYLEKHAREEKREAGYLGEDSVKSISRDIHNNFFGVHSERQKQAAIFEKKDIHKRPVKDILAFNEDRVAVALPYDNSFLKKAVIVAAIFFVAISIFYNLPFGMKLNFHRTVSMIYDSGKKIIYNTSEELAQVGWRIIVETNKNASDFIFKRSFFAVINFHDQDTQLVPQVAGVKETRSNYQSDKFNDIGVDIKYLLEKIGDKQIETSLVMEKRLNNLLLGLSNK